MATSTAASPTRRKSPVGTPLLLTARSPRAHTKAAPSPRAWTGRSVQEPTLTLSWVSMVRWIRSAKDQDQIEYHAGHLAEDREAASQNFPPELSREINATADLLWIACHLGIVSLFSKRNGRGQFSYLAVRSCESVHATDPLLDRHRHGTAWMTQAPALSLTQ